MKLNINSNKIDNIIVDLFNKMSCQFSRNKINNNNLQIDIPINRFILTIKKIIWLSKNRHHINHFITKTLEKTLNNETIGQTAEYCICLISKIECNINSKRINPIIRSKLNKILQTNNILQKLPSSIYESCGYKNGSIDFKLKNNETLSIKTLKHNDGRVCPQTVGQPTLKSWDKIWNKEWDGKIDKNPDRWEFIKINIHNYLNRMLEGIFCCDYLIIIKNCINKPEIVLYHKELLIKKLNYFQNQTIIYTRDKYEERWNDKKQKYSEMSSTIKINILDEEIAIGEFQFHKSSRKQLKFRFSDKFLQTLF